MPRFTRAETVGALDDAEAALRAGGAIVVPTDTVYGLAALPDVPGAVDALFRAKGRAEDKPIPILGAAVDDLHAVAALDERARRLGARFWPGPLTLVLPRAPGFNVVLGRGDADTVAVRVPAHPVALELLRMAGPLAVTSANRSGEAPATTVDEARSALGAAVRVFLDGGKCDGAPSTIVALAPGFRLLREGALTQDDLLEAASA